MFKPFRMLSPKDLAMAERYTGSLTRKPDLTIAPDGHPYLYRWLLLEKKIDGEGQCYFHMQIADDPERPLHDHPWDNMSVILSGGYNEIYQTEPPHGSILSAKRSVGEVIFRRASTAHRLLMGGHPYTLTQFTTGPKIHDWGFWYGDIWVPYQQVTEQLPGGLSVHKPGTDARRTK